MRHLLALAICASFLTSGTRAGAALPNVLWFVVDDMSPQFSCYGETTIQTPNVDKLAADGTKFTRAYVTAPVCSTCRSAMITGMYQTSIGAHHHRSGRGALKIRLPEGIKTVPQLFQEAGYYTCIGSGLVDKDFRGDSYDQRASSAKRAKRKDSIVSFRNRLGKTDYNFEWTATIYNSHDWAGRASDQPFFMQVQLPGGKLREGTPAARDAFRQRVISQLGSAVDPINVTLPPYYPHDSVLIDDWALYLDAVRLTDQHVGAVMKRLANEGLLENTVVIFMTDHGISHARGKQFLYDEGTHIPFIVRGPGIARSAVRQDLIEHIDMAATSLAAAGIARPEAMHSRDVFAANDRPREAVFAARDRCDETVERIRSVRTDRFLYIRNFLPQRPHLQPNAYKDAKLIVQTLRKSHQDGNLPVLTEQLLFSPTRPSEELYDYREDAWQINNLASYPAFQAALDSHRAQLDQWMIETRDSGFENEAMYDSDMAEYLKKENSEVKRNIATMKQWAKQGI